MSDPDNFDDDELEGDSQPRVAFDPNAQAREATMHFYAHTQAYGQLKQVGTQGEGGRRGERVGRRRAAGGEEAVPCGR
jgi:hypothetical protein